MNMPIATRKIAEFNSPQTEPSLVQPGSAEAGPNEAQTSPRVAPDRAEYPPVKRKPKVRTGDWR